MSQSALFEQAMAVLRDARMGLPEGQAPTVEQLDAVARERSFGSWHELIESVTSLALQGRRPPQPTILEIDPDLPARFDSTPNDERSTAELDRWWDIPYAIRNGDGTLACRALAGGASDRSTWFGNAGDEVEALELVTAKLSDWWAQRRAPRMVYDQDGCSVVIVQQRPDEPETVLGSKLSIEDASQFVATAYAARTAAGRAAAV